MKTLKKWNAIVGIVLATFLCMVYFMPFKHYSVNRRAKTYDFTKFIEPSFEDEDGDKRTKRLVTGHVINYKSVGQRQATPPSSISISNATDDSDNYSSSVNWTILVSVSNGFHDMFNNWWHYYRKLHLKIPVIMIAEDSKTFQQYNNQKELFVWFGDNDVENLEALSYQSKGYLQMVSKRATYISNQLAQGVNVLYTDIDTVWMKDPRPYFKGHCDIWAVLDGPKYYCTGFMAILNNQNTRKFIEVWQTELLDKNQLNQPIFNQILNTTEILIKHCPLPTTVFPSGKEYFKQNYKGDVVLIHNNYIIGHQKKVERFKARGLWHPGRDMDAQ